MTPRLFFVSASVGFFIASAAETTAWPAGVPADGDDECSSHGSGREGTCALSVLQRKVAMHAARNVSWASLADKAEKMRSVYDEGMAFPSWSVDKLRSGELEELAGTAVVYYTKGDDLEKVKLEATQREPVNIGMWRGYDQDKLKEYFGYSVGAYGMSSASAGLMPNIAIYARSLIRNDDGRYAKVHVINAVAFGFDSPLQPDYQHFLPLTTARRSELVRKMTQMWHYMFECAKRQGLKRVYLADVGGGAFSAGLGWGAYDDLKEESLTPVLKKYAGVVDHGKLGWIPKWPFSAEGLRLINDSLLVNAWDPWAMVGNGNALDHSLDGFWGRCSSLAVLCWPVTNPLIRYEAVGEL